MPTPLPTSGQHKKLEKLKLSDIFSIRSQRTSIPLPLAPLPVTSPFSSQHSKEWESEPLSGAEHHLKRSTSPLAGFNVNEMALFYGIPCPSCAFICPQVKQQTEDQWLFSKQRGKCIFQRSWWLTWLEKNCSWLVYLEILKFKLSINGLGVENRFIYLYSITKLLY